MGLFNKKKKSISDEGRTIEQTKSKETALLMLVERQIPDMKNYFMQFGIAIEQIYTDIEEAKIGMLIQSGRARIVIVDSGLAKFTTTSMRAEVKDLLGLCDGEDKFGTVFYTDSLLKSDNTKGKRGSSSVDWVSYSGTRGIIDKLNSYKETYVSSNSSERDDSVPKREDILSFKGDYVKPIYSGIDLRNSSTEKVDKVLQLVKQDGTAEDSLTQFDVSY